MFNKKEYNREYSRRYHKTHKEERKAAARIARENNREMYRLLDRKWREKHRGSVEYKSRKNKNSLQYLCKKYGITQDDYNRMFVEQGGCCKVCGVHQVSLRNRLSIDHDHITGKVRGLLCIKCNSAIGYVKENISILESMIKYLNQDQIIKDLNK